MAAVAARFTPLVFQPNTLSSYCEALSRDLSASIPFQMAGNVLGLSGVSASYDMSLITCAGIQTRTHRVLRLLLEQIGKMRRLAAAFHVACS